MKTTRKIAKNKFFATFMSLVILLTTTYNANAYNSPFDEMNKEISGEQMFKEIFFFEGGNMSRTLPKAIQKEYTLVKSQSLAQKKERTKIINKVLGLIKQNNPSYFNLLKKSVLSKNPYEIKKQILAGGNMIINGLNLQEESKSLSKYLERKQIDLTNKEEVNKVVNDLKRELKSNSLSSSKKKLSAEISQETCIAFAFALAIAVAVAGVAVLVTVFVEVINYNQFSSSKSRNLKADQYVSSIISNYS